MFFPKPCKYSEPAGAFYWLVLIGFLLIAFASIGSIFLLCASKECALEELRKKEEYHTQNSYAAKRQKIEAELASLHQPTTNQTGPKEVAEK